VLQAGAPINASGLMLEKVVYPSFNTKGGPKRRMNNDDED
jgi:hypothetical protein